MIHRIFAPLLALALTIAVSAASSAQAAQAPTPADLVALKAALVGTWQSLDDPKFTREFAGDGKAADRYEGDDSATTRGHWVLFLGSAPPSGTSSRSAFQKDVVYLRLDENGDVLLFALAGLSRSDMKMVYLERGNLLSFVRLK